MYNSYLVSRDLVLADLDGLVRVTLAVKAYVVDGILLLHAIVHGNNLDTRGRHFTFRSHEWQ